MNPERPTYSILTCSLDWLIFCNKKFFINLSRNLEFCENETHWNLVNGTCSLSLALRGKIGALSFVNGVCEW